MTKPQLLDVIQTQDQKRRAMTKKRMLSCCNVRVLDGAKKIKNVTDVHGQHENISIVECERMSGIVLIVVVVVYIGIFMFNTTRNK